MSEGFASLLKKSTWLVFSISSCTVSLLHLFCFVREVFMALSGFLFSIWGVSPFFFFASFSFFLLYLPFGYFHSDFRKSILPLPSFLLLLFLFYFIFSLFFWKVFRFFWGGEEGGGGGIWQAIPRVLVWFRWIFSAQCDFFGGFGKSRQSLMAACMFYSKRVTEIRKWRMKMEPDALGHASIEMSCHDRRDDGLDKCHNVRIRKHLQSRKGLTWLLMLWDLYFVAPADMAKMTRHSCPGFIFRKGMTWQQRFSSAKAGDVALDVAKP